jgi:CheY-like chemotaxis protein
MSGRSRTGPLARLQDPVGNPTAEHDPGARLHFEHSPLAMWVYDLEHEGEIDLMVTDVVMPRMSGNELVGHARPLRPDMRVLYASGYSEEAIARHGQLTEGIELLSKPFTSGVLTAKIRQILDRTS